MKARYITPEETKTPEKQLQEDIFYRVHLSMQLCWWYVLYAPEYGNWEKKKTIEFSKKIDELNIKLNAAEKGEESAIKTKLIAESGIDYVALAAKIPYKTKLKMYGGAVPRMNGTLKIAFPFQMNMAAREGMFMPIYILFYEYGSSREEIETYLKYFYEFAAMYEGGLHDKHIMKYFEDLEEIPIFRQEEKEEYENYYNSEH